MIFVVSAFIGAVPGVVLVLTPDADLQTVFQISNIATIVLNVAGMLLTTWWFPAYYFANMETFNKPLEKEIETWNQQHPDHEYAHWGTDGNDSSGQQRQQQDNN